MDNFQLTQFVMLLRREIWEHKGLFIGAPLVQGLIFLVAALWAFRLPGQEVLTGLLEQLGSLTDGLSASQLAPMLMPIAVPFIIVFYICAVVYMINCLYQDRRDSSIMFWQSMPVSNLKTVLSKIFVVCAIAPLFVVAVLFVLQLLATISIVFMNASYGVDSISFARMLGAAIYSLLLVYLSMLLAGLWLFPTLGWILLFSAFARALPFLWAMGTYILILFLEDFVFGTQFLTNWLESRSGFVEYIVFSPGDFFVKLFSYEMLLGVVFGAVLITGAVYMRRFVD